MDTTKGKADGKAEEAQRGQYLGFFSGEEEYAKRQARAAAVAKARLAGTGAPQR